MLIFYIPFFSEVNFNVILVHVFNFKYNLWNKRLLEEKNGLDIGMLGMLL